MADFKRIGSKIYGVQFSAKEQEAIDREIKLQLAEHDRLHAREVDAVVLWELRKRYGFGMKKLKEFYFGFGDAINELLRRYEMGEDDTVWLATRKLKDELGIDLAEWETEWEAQNVHT